MLYLITLYAYLLNPISDKVEGTYLQYLNSQYAIVHTWTDADAVVGIAKLEHFQILAYNDQNIILKLKNPCKELRLHLLRLGNDASVDYIKPLQFKDIIVTNTKMIAHK